MLSILSNTYLEVEFLDHRVNLFLIFQGTTVLFSQQLYHFTFPTTVHRVLISPYPYQYIVFQVWVVFFFLIVAILIWMKVALHCVILHVYSRLSLWILSTTLLLLEIQEKQILELLQMLEDYLTVKNVHT